MARKPVITADRTVSKEDYFPQLDGLRTFAFLLVFMHHLTPSAAEFAAINRYCAWGWSGVDLFFVLSGFLITYLLLKEKRTFGSISLKSFYIRRVLRIWPLYYLVIAAVTLIPLTMADWTRMDFYWRYVSAIVVPFCFFLGNYAIPDGFPIMLGFCDAWHLASTRLTTMIQPLWSLCIEEQFYLIWPFALLFMNRTRTVWLTIGGLIAASFLIRLWLYHYGWAVGRGNYVLFYFNTASHMDALMIGAAVAFAEVRWQGWAKKLLSGWSGALVLAAVLAGYATIANSSWPIEMGRRSSVTLMSVISGGCGLVLLLSLYWQPMRSLLSNSVLRHIGKLTYAMYVFHFWLADACSGWIRRTLVSSELVFWVLHVILTFVLTYAVAQVSWTLLESRMLTLRRRFRRQLTSAPLQERTKELVPV